MPTTPDPTTPTTSSTRTGTRTGTAAAGRTGIAVPKRVRVTGAARDKLGERLRTQYEKGASIRQLADQTGRSYGFVHGVLLDAGVTLRRRGGTHPRRRTTTK